MKRTLLFALLCFLFFSTQVFSEVYLNFNNVNVKTVVEFLAKELGKNVIYDESLRGKITIMSKSPVDEDTAWKMIEESLLMLGAVVFEENGYVKIVSKNKAKRFAPEVKSQEKGLSEYQILIYVTKKFNASHLIKVLRPFVSPAGSIVYITGTPVIIVKDYSYNIKKLKDFLEVLEKTEGLYRVKVFKLRHAPVDTIYRNVSALIQSISNAKGLTSKIAKDERTNSLIVYGNDLILREVENIIKELDVPATEATYRKFWVIKLNYSSAEDLAKVLHSLNIQRLELGDKTKKKVKQRHTFLKGGLKIAADKSSNTLIIYATKEEYEKVKELVEKLDTRKKQVLLVTTIVEVSFSKLRELGIKWQALGSYGGVAFGGASLSDVYTAVTSGNLVLGAVSKSGTQVNVGTSVFFFPDLLFLFSLIEEKSVFNIVSNPKILTVDNKEATINVGESVPYTTGITYQTNALPTVSFEYKDVGLRLNITPHIIGNTVRLEIKQSLQEVTDIYRATQGVIDFVAPRTSKREISSEVIVDNGQTVILGGLVSSKSLKSRSRVPFLSRIPLLGHLFKRSQARENKTTLFVFITPYIVSSPEELKRITEEHKILSEDIKKLVNFSRGG